MGMIRAAFIALALLVLAAPARSEDPDIIAQFRFRGAPGDELQPVEQQRALAYRNELQRQLRSLDEDDMRGQLSPLERRRLLDTRTELGRMKGVLAPKPSGGIGVSTYEPLPSLSGAGGIPLLAPH